jgi:hypothetical protein
MFRRLLTTANERLARARAAANGATLDVLALAGLVLIAFGAWHVPGGWGDVLGPIVLGCELILTVRLGSA